MASHRAGTWWDLVDQPATKIQKLVYSACTPSFSGPDMSLFLEIASQINEKKLNAPREAATAIVSRINSNSLEVARLALMLLDICVKNCGYPFHLQIASREFLNELVKRFPERPPPRRSERMIAILEQIELWYITICRSSRYKNDLGFIRDMRALLSRKGYSFPSPKPEDIAVLRQADTVQSAEEMEQEDREAQEAKLQELIRRGTPRDLEEANKLMKVLTGFDERNRTDYRAKAAEEVAKVQEKAKLLEEMIQLRMNGDNTAEGDVYEDIANALISAHRKIQKMCEEESDDTEAVGKLLSINDSISRTIQRYKLLKQGDLSSAAQINPGTLGTSGLAVSRGTGDDLLLVDLDDHPGEPEALIDNSSQSFFPSQNSGPTPVSNSTSLMDDLLGLSLGEPSGAISLPPLRSGPIAAPPSMSNSKLLSNINTTSSVRPSSQELLSGLHNSSHPSPVPSPGFPPSLQSKDLIGLHRKKPTDPFATLSLGLASSKNSYSSPPSQPSKKCSSLNLVDTPSLPNHKLISPASPPVTGAGAAATSQQENVEDDDQWEFTSALPVLPTKASLNVSQPADPLDIKWEVSREDEGIIRIRSVVKSRVEAPLQGIVVEIAANKVYKLEVKPQSSTVLLRPTDSIFQEVTVSPVLAGQGQSVQIRWRARYRYDHSNTEERKLMGVVNGLGIE